MFGYIGAGLNFGVVVVNAIILANDLSMVVSAAAIVVCSGAMMLGIAIEMKEGNKRC